MRFRALQDITVRMIVGGWANIDRVVFDGMCIYEGHYVNSGIMLVKDNGGATWHIATGNGWFKEVSNEATQTTKCQ